MHALEGGVQRVIQRKYSALISKPMQAQIDKAIGERAVGK
jgi:hypothetical protein